jgi:V/A-type H+-transporting ATPase subunit D
VSAPTGRSGRLRLAHQIDVARRGSDLLERKQRILGGEVTRLRLLTRRSREDWQDAAADAARWLRRCQGLDGAERVAAVAAPEPAVVRVNWLAAMGVVYPGEVVTVLPPEHPTAGSSALVLALRAHRRALEVAARHAAAERALALVTVELEVTRLRQQAIERRLLPRLTGRLRQLEAQLDELEREENVRLRWAAGTRDGGRQR